MRSSTFYALLIFDTKQNCAALSVLTYFRVVLTACAHFTPPPSLNSLPLALSVLFLKVAQLDSLVDGITLLLASVKLWRSWLTGHTARCLIVLAHMTSV